MSDETPVTKVVPAMPVPAKVEVTEAVKKALEKAKEEPIASRVKAPWETGVPNHGLPNDMRPKRRGEGLC